ncbi:MAG: hypothetical protein QXO75_05235 [Nitrososphaerota archaeon]
MHNREMTWNVPSFSTISTFSGEMKDSGISHLLIAEYSVFYSSQNIKEPRDSGMSPNTP